MSDPQPGPEESDAPEDLALPTDFWASPLPPEVVAPGGDATPTSEAEERVAWNDPDPADLTGSWFWADDAPEAPRPEDTGDVVIGPDWWEGGDELEAPLPDDLVLVPAPTDEPAPLPLAVLPGPEERSDGRPEDLSEDLLFAPAWGDGGEEPQTGLADDLSLPPAAVDAPEPFPSAVLPSPFAPGRGSEEAGEDLFFASTWVDDGDEPPTELPDDLILAPMPDDLILAPDLGLAPDPVDELGPVDEPGTVEEPEPLTLAVFPGPRPPAGPGPGRWDQWREHRPGARATVAVVVGLVLGMSVLVGVLSRSDTSSKDVASGPTTVLPAPPRSVATTQVPILPASPVDVTEPAPDAPATDAPATDAVPGPVQVGGGSSPVPAAGAPARATGAPPAQPAAGPRPAAGPSPRPAPAPAPAPAAASANPAPAAANPPPRQDQPPSTLSRRDSRTTIPPTTQAPPPPTTTPPADDGDQLPCFAQIQHGRLACP